MSNPCLTKINSRKTLWRKRLNCYISSLALGYNMNPDDIRKVWEVFEAKTRTAITPRPEEPYEDFLIRFVDIFYVITIKAFNMYVLDEETYDIEPWFADYMDLYFESDLNEGIWFDIEHPRPMYTEEDFMYCSTYI